MCILSVLCMIDNTRYASRTLCSTGFLSVCCEKIISACCVWYHTYSAAVHTLLRTYVRYTYTAERERALCVYRLKQRKFCSVIV